MKYRLEKLTMMEILHTMKVSSILLEQLISPNLAESSKIDKVVIKYPDSDVTVEKSVVSFISQPLKCSHRSLLRASTWTLALQMKNHNFANLTQLETWAQVQLKCGIKTVMTKDSLLFTITSKDRLRLATSKENFQLTRKLAHIL